MKRLASVLVLSVLGVCPGCGDSHDKVAADTVSTMTELVATLETVKDQASAKAAKPKLTALEQRMKSLEERQTKLGAPNEADGKAMMEKYSKEMEPLQQKLMASMMRIQFDPAIQAELGDIDMVGTK